MNNPYNGIRPEWWWLAAAAALAWAVPAPGAYDSTSLTDIPTNEFLDHGQLEVDALAGYSRDPQVPAFASLNGSVGAFGFIETGVALKSITSRLAVTGHFKVEVFDEEHYVWWQPALCFGMDDITLGSGRVSNYGRRYPSDTDAYGMVFHDNVSPYVVASKTAGEIGTFHLGLGAGRFQGGGPISEHLHGIFAGYNRRLFGRFEVMAEEDGRDVNVGVRNNFGWGTVAFAVERVEQIGRAYYPGFTLTLEVSPLLLHQGPERLALRREITDYETRIAAVRKELGSEATARADVQKQIDALLAEYRNQGIDPADLKVVYNEIEKLQSDVDAARAKSTAPPEPAPVGGGI